MSTKSPEPPRPLSGMKVIVAEDSWHIARALRLVLEGAGATVAGLASTLQEAEDLAAREMFDAALVDLDLHDEKAHALAERMSQRSIKVVVITGHSVPASLAAKVHASIAKPASADALIAALERPLRK